MDEMKDIAALVVVLFAVVASILGAVVAAVWFARALPSLAIPLGVAAGIALLVWAVRRVVQWQ